MSEKTNKIECFKMSPCIAAAFWGKKGGVIEGEYGSLNCAFKSYTPKEKVIQNHKIIASTMGGNFKNKLFLPLQKHLCNAHVLIQDNVNDSVHADSIITNLPNILIGVLTADCCPILLYEDSVGYIAAIHAGWRGALGMSIDSGIIENTLYKLFDLGCKIENIKAAIGPCINQTSYEVDKEFEGRFLLQDSSYKKFFIKQSENQDNKFYFDLPGFAAHRLQMLGVENIETHSIDDTFSDSEHYFSYRRATKRYGNQNTKYGCQASVIGLIK